MTEIERRLRAAQEAERALRDAKTPQDKFRAHQHVEEEVSRLREELESGQQEDAEAEEAATTWLDEWDADPSSAPLPAVEDDPEKSKRGVRVRRVDATGDTGDSGRS